MNLLHYNYNKYLMNYNFDILLLASYYIEKESNYNIGRWSNEEKNRFIIGLKYFGKNNKLIQKIVKTRSLVQIRSHSQKFFKKIYKKKI